MEVGQWLARWPKWHQNPLKVDSFGWLHLLHFRRQPAVSAMPPQHLDGLQFQGRGLNAKVFQARQVRQCHVADVDPLHFIPCCPGLKRTDFKESCYQLIGKTWQRVWKEGSVGHSKDILHQIIKKVSIGPNKGKSFPLASGSWTALTIPLDVSTIYAGCFTVSCPRT